MAGIDVFVHWTFLLLLIWIGAAYLMQGASPLAALQGVLVILAYFFCVVLHEYGHALMARRYGVGTKDITLLPIGGVARLDHIPEDPWQEFWIAVAGPAVNVAIALLITGILAVQGSFGTTINADQLTATPFLHTLLAFNVMVVLFNLLPAFPMDGGRILRSLLAMRTNYVRATRTAANVGQMMAMLFGIVGLFYSPLLIFIAIFVYLGAEAEARSAEMKAATEDVRVQEAMMTIFRTLSPDDSLDDAAYELLAGAQQDFPVVDQGRLVGILCRSDLVKAFSSDHSHPVGEVMNRSFVAAKDSEMLDQVMQRMQESKCGTVPVLRGSTLVGLLTLENVGELMMLRSAKRNYRVEPTEVEHMVHAPQ